MFANSISVAGTSSAYDLERIGAIPEIPLEIPKRRPERVRVKTGEPVRVSPETERRLRERARERAGAKTVNGQFVSPFAVVGFLCVGFMLILMLISYTQLAVATDQAAKLETELAALNETANQLEVDYESAFNIVEIENYARNILGMNVASSNQIRYLENVQEDRSYIFVQQEEHRDFGILTSISDFFSSLFY